MPRMDCSPPPEGPRILVTVGEEWLAVADQAPWSLSGLRGLRLKSRNLFLHGLYTEHTRRGCGWSEIRCDESSERSSDRNQKAVAK